MRKRVFIMNPPSELYRRDDRCQSKVEDQTVRVVFPPIELAVLAAMARDLGAAVMLRDYPTVAASAEDYLEDIGEFQPDLILLNSTVHTIEQDLHAFTLARELFPGVMTIAKGEALAIQAETILKDFPDLDVILDGEAETSFPKLVQDEPFRDVPGIVWRNEYSIPIRNAAAPFIENLDSLPFPARDLLDQSLYRSPENGRIITAIYAQRGCPAKCIFCPAGSLYNYTVRERSVKSVADEIQECVERYGIRDFLFHGDTFTLHKKWLIGLCREILDRGLDIHWGCNSRVDTIDDERAEWMKKAGCWVVAFGFEHGDQQMLDHMKKGARVSKAPEAVRVCRRHGLQVHGFFVIGLPWESRETLETAYGFVRSLDLDYFDFNIAYPLPGTEYYEIVKKEGLFETPDPTRGGYAQAAVKTHELTSDELTEWRRRALLKMYCRPGWIFRVLRNAASNGNTMFYAREAWFRLNRLIKI